MKLLDSDKLELVNELLDIIHEKGVAVSEGDNTRSDGLIVASAACEIRALIKGGGQ